MQLVKSVAEMRKLVSELRADRTVTIGFVPTMGNLHAGHTSLIERSAQQASFTIVSIYVNPSQFAPNEDLASYPRTLEDDLRECKNAGAHCIFIPSTEEVYPEDYCTWVETDVGRAQCNARSEGASRPTFFRGVATMVSKLMFLMQPHKVFFGQKDAQQVAVVKRLISDLWIDCELVVCETVREPNGLAMSSRNGYLTDKERHRGSVLWQALQAGKEVFAAGVPAEHIRETIRNTIEEHWGTGVKDVLYVSVCHRYTMKEIHDEVPPSGPVLACVAAMVGKARLIDNIVLR